MTDKPASRRLPALALAMVSLSALALSAACGSDGRVTGATDSGTGGLSEGGTGGESTGSTGATPSGGSAGSTTTTGGSSTGGTPSVGGTGGGGAEPVAGSGGATTGGTAGGESGGVAGSGGFESGGSSGDAPGGTGGGIATGGSGGGSPGGGGEAGATLGSPTYQTEFDSGSGWGDRSDPTGSVEYGASGGHDGNVAVLTFPGDPALDSGDNTSPSHATEIYWQERQYGTFRARLELARCSGGEEVVNGIFTYAHGGDTNNNSITDNSEIDIEILCGEPYIIFLTSWTDYDNDSSFRKWSRAIDTRSGDYRESPTATEYGLGPVLGNIAGANVPGFPETGRFYEMGFDWQPDRIRWFLVFDTEEVTLWDFTDASLIPQNPAAFLFNVWHAPTHWYEGGAADYPASDAVMRVDWFRYWAYP